MAGPGQRSVAFLFSDKGRHLPPPQSHCPSQMRDSLGRTARPRRISKVHVFYFSTEDKNPSLRASLGWDQRAISFGKILERATGIEPAKSGLGSSTDLGALHTCII